MDANSGNENENNSQKPAALSMQLTRDRLGCLLAVAAVTDPDPSTEPPPVKDTGPHSRGIPILDALASLCVSKARGEAIAIGAQIMRKDDNRIRLVLTVAGNHELSTKLPQHLLEVWGMLQQLASLRELERHDKEQKKRVIARLRDALLEHHYAKVRKRFYKRFEKFMSFGRMFCTLPTEEWPRDFMDARTKFKAVLRLIMDMADCFDTEPFQVGKLTVITVLASLSHLLEKISFRTSQIDPGEMIYLEGIAKEYGAAGFPLGRYLGKLSTFHRSVSSLIRWAQSPRRLRDTLKHSLEIQIVTSKPGCIPRLPRTSAGWEEVVRNIVDKSGFLQDGSFIQGAAAAVCKFYAHSPKAAPAVHCEVALILHYQSRPVSSVPPVRSIGVSKPSCSACWGWVQHLNSKNQTRYAVDGADKECFDLWGIPEHAQLSMGFWEQYTTSLEHLVCERWEAQSLIQSSSVIQGEEIVVTYTGPSETQR